jgi:hypothetical protein
MEAQDRFSEGTLITDVMSSGDTFTAQPLQASQTKLAEPFEYNNSPMVRQPHHAMRLRVN